MTYCTSDHTELYDTDMIREGGDVHPTPVCPAVICNELVHPDDDKGPSGVVVQIEMAISLPLVVFVGPDQLSVGHAVVNVVEVLETVLMILWIFTPEGKWLTLHTRHRYGFDTCQTCRSKLKLLVPKRFVSITTLTRKEHIILKTSSKEFTWDLY